MSSNLEEFPKISTGNGYANDLTATTNDRLERNIKALLELERTFKVKIRKPEVH